MRKYETKTKTIIKEATECTSITCDICGKDGTNGWSKNSYDAEDVVIYREEGNVYPSGGFVTRYFIDMCPECFDTKFAGWLKDMNVRLQIEERDW